LRFGTIGHWSRSLPYLQNLIKVSCDILPDIKRVGAALHVQGAAHIGVLSTSQYITPHGGGVVGGHKGHSDMKLTGGFMLNHNGIALNLIKIVKLAQELPQSLKEILLRHG